jgi:predicted PolB exonuclease-like 3'-5' exonuclease
MCASTKVNLQDERSVRLIYERDGDVLRFKMQNISNHEVMEIMIGLIARMRREDRYDLYEAIIHYAEFLNNPEHHHDVFLSPIAAAVAQRDDLRKAKQ